LKFYAQARRQYVPKVYRRELIVFKGSEDSLDLRRWQELAAGGLKVYEVPGDHHSVLNGENLPLFAEQLKHCLDTAYSATSTKRTTVREQAHSGL
jgi:hypothetical protein